MRRAIVTVVFVAALAPARAPAARLKELVTVDGFRSNHLVGLGLVVGLTGTGDDAISIMTRKPLAALLRHLGTMIDETSLTAKNVAVVMVTAELPPFARAGSSLDVTVSSAGNAKNLTGGTLVMTPLKGPDGETYALAQGALTLGGFAVAAGSGASTKKNHVTVGRIPGGGVLERDAPSGMPTSELTLVLHDADFTTAWRIARVIDAYMGAGSARVRDPAAVTVCPGPVWKNRTVELIAHLEALDATPDAPARVIIDERTGTIAIGNEVRLGAAALAHGGIHIKIEQHPVILAARGAVEGSDRSRARRQRFGRGSRRPAGGHRAGDDGGRRGGGAQRARRQAARPRRHLPGAQIGGCAARGDPRTMTRIGPSASPPPANEPNDDAVAKAARGLEAHFLRQVLAEVRDAAPALDGGFAGSTFKEMLDGALSDSMAASGGIGLGKMIAKELSRNPGGKSQAVAGTGPAAPGGDGGAAIARDQTLTPLAGLPVRPVTGVITSRYGARVDPIENDQRIHAGVDLRAAVGTPARAAEAGVVVRAEAAGGYGNLVVLDHGGGLETRYGHLGRIDVRVGQRVTAGEPVGEVGASGRATGPHLHFEVRRDGRTVDPIAPKVSTKPADAY